MDELGLVPGRSWDVLVGGPPCQSFSTAGRRGTVSDPRGQLIWDYLRFVEALRPRYFLMENVRGLLSAALQHRPIAERPERGGPPLLDEEKPGSVVEAWIEDLGKIDGGAYRVDIFEVNSVNYGGPQLRERVLFIGNRESKCVDFPEPTHGPTASYPDLLPFKTLGEALDGLIEDAPVLMDFSPRKKRFLEQVPPGGNWRMLPTDVAMESMGKAFFAKGGRSGWWRRLSRTCRVRRSQRCRTIPVQACVTRTKFESFLSESVLECRSSLTGGSSPGRRRSRCSKWEMRCRLDSAWWLDLYSRSRRVHP